MERVYIYDSVDLDYDYSSCFRFEGISTEYDDVAYLIECYLNFYKCFRLFVCGGFKNKAKVSVFIIKTDQWLFTDKVFTCKITMI